MIKPEDIKQLEELCDQEMDKELLKKVGGPLLAGQVYSAVKNLNRILEHYIDLPFPKDIATDAVALIIYQTTRKDLVRPVYTGIGIKKWTVLKDYLRESNLID